MMLTVKAATDVGLKRTHNEDSYGVWAPEDPADEPRGTLIVVADGMGGAQAGEVASRLAVECLMRRHRETCEHDVLECLRRSVEAANRAIYEQAQAHPEMRGMGTTCTAVVVVGPDAYFAHVGDSRIYLVRRGGIRQMTGDHSLVAELVSRQYLTAEQARVDPRRNVVTRSVGVRDSIEVDVDRFDTPLVPGDTLVLCTDGLHGLVEDLEIAGFASGSDLDDGTRGMIDLARERGAPDNVTVVLARVE